MPKRKNRIDKHKDTARSTNASGHVFIVSPEDRERFTNPAKPIPPSEYAERQKLYGQGLYKFDRVPRLLIIWGRLFQALVSQAGTKKLTGKYHDTECGIYKTEGGCKIAGVNDLVLNERTCYWDYGRDTDKNLLVMVDLISEMVLQWDPCNPVNSLLSTAATFIGEPKEDLKAAIDKSSCGGVFGGNPLSYFFDKNPFDRNDDGTDEYLRFCKIHINGDDPAAVEQFFADKKLGRELYQKLDEKVRANKPNGFGGIYSCSPKRFDGALRFWINTGRSTQLDGYKSQEEIELFLKGDGVLREQRR